MSADLHAPPYPALEPDYTDVISGKNGRAIDNYDPGQPLNGAHHPLPHNLQAEQSLLGAMLLSKDAVANTVDVLTADDFYKPNHGHIYDAIIGLYRDDQPVDPITVAERLRRAGLLDTIGGQSALVTLQTLTPNTSSAASYARIVAEHAVLRRFLYATEELREAALSLPDDFSELRRLAENAVELVTQHVEPGLGHQAVPGGSFILDAPAVAPAVWGRDEQVLWAEGEPLYIVGPAGVGKTTLVGQLVFARLGLIEPEVLGWPVTPAQRILYLACDRPNQIRRAFRRLAHDDWRDVLDDRLVVWKGPPTKDVAKNPESLLALCRAARADTVIIDSLKDVAIGLSDDEVGAGVNSAVQRCIAEGIEVLGNHHQRKGQDGRKPKTLEDVYGSTWITAGAGSVILLWGRAGDLIVDLEHLKQPSAEIGPLKIEHDHIHGRSSIYRGFDLLRFLRGQPNGTTAKDAARQWFEHEPTDNERKKAQRALDQLVAHDPPLAVRQEGERGAATGQMTSARYFAIVDADEF